MVTWTASAPGKLILTGEHSVVYGYPAVCAALDKRTECKVTKTKGEKDVDFPWYIVRHYPDYHTYSV